MFSSTTNPFSPFIIDHHEINSDIFLQQNQPTIPLLPVTETSTTSLSLLNNDQQQQQQQVANCVLVPEKKKKDRHSKIYTAQGLRDRRVRLSIEIARRFFHLQDMLGFDKASKTLEWLLNKSKKSIKEVEQNGRSSASTFQEEALALSSKENGEQVDDVKEKVAEDGDQGGIGIVSSSTSIYNSNKKNTKKLQKCVVAKESRAKARARARERTRIKMSNRKFNHSSFTQILMNEYSTPNLVEQPNFDTNSVPKENNIVEESFVIKRTLKPYPIMGYQQNLVMLKDLICNGGSNNNNNNLLPNLAQNWEINSAIARSSFCAITNMNRSTGLHLCGKLWEAENSSHQCLL